MKRIIAALAVAVVSTPLFAMEPTLETQKHDSSLMMDGMKSLNSKVEATWVSKEQTESVAKESAATLNSAELEAAPAVERAKSQLAADKNKINTTVPNLCNCGKCNCEKEKDGWVKKTLKTGAIIAGVLIGLRILAGILIRPGGYADFSH